MLTSPIWNHPKVKCDPKDVATLYNKIDKKGRRYTTVPIHAPGETKGDTNNTFRGIHPPKGRHWRCSVEELERLDAAGLIEWSKNGNPRKINYADEHMSKKAQDIWEFKDPTRPVYPTEKNLDMLKFIIEASSDKESIVMDCFCGSGTTLLAAEMCGRKWIGIDQSDIAIKTTEKKINPTSLFNEKKYIFIDLSS